MRTWRSQAKPSRFGGGVPSYSSRVCRTCDRDYLYPAYGGWANCNDCRLARTEPRS